MSTSRTILRAARHAADLQILADRSGLSHDPEQPRSGGGRATRRTWSSTAGAGRQPAPGKPSTPSWTACANWKTMKRSWCSRASRWRFSAPTQMPRAC